MAIRYDRAPIKATKTPEGFLHDSPVLSRVGVFEYRQPDGTVRREFRPPEEVFHPNHLASLNLKPITDEHHGMITGSNARSKLVGSIVSPGRQDGDNLVGDIVIYDANVLATKKELSLTYSLELDETPGEYQGQRYDAVQRQLLVNSTAIVKRGRAGNARLNLDAADAVAVNPEDDEPIMTTVKHRLDSGIEYDVPPEVAVALAAQTAKITAEKTRADTAEAARDTLQAKVDGHETALKTAREDARKEAAARVKLEADAAGLGVKFNADAKDAEIRIAVIKHVRGDSADMTGKSDAYVEASFDMALADGLKAKANGATQRRDAGAGGARQDSEGPAKGSAAAARAGMVAGLTNTKTEA